VECYLGLAHCNFEINWKTEEVKITRYLEKYRDKNKENLDGKNKKRKKQKKNKRRKEEK